MLAGMNAVWLERLPKRLGGALTAGLFLLDLIIPDVIPMADELLLGLAAMILASWRKRAGPQGRK